MTRNVNIINNVGNNVNVKVEEINGTTQIVIDIPQAKADLNILNPGDVFEMCGVEYIVCEQFSDGKTAVVRKECLDDTIRFGNDNNWKNSDLRAFLNNEYYNEIKNIFGVKNIVDHEVDLLSLDGYDDYGVSMDKVSVMNIDRYRKYHKYIGDTKTWYWLSTPDSTPSGTGSSGVQCVNSGGDVNWDDAGDAESVRPFFLLLNLKVMKS